MTLQTDRTIETSAPFGSLVATVLDGHRESGPVMVVWPSVLSTAAVQSDLMQRLSRHGTVVAVDPPGHGRSRIEDPVQLSMRACALATWDLVDLLEPTVDETAVRWVGTSWGGLVGIEAELLAPCRMAHLACLNTPFAFAKPTALRPPMLPMLAHLMGTSAFFAAMTARSFFLPSTRTSRSPEHVAALTAHRQTFTGGDRRQLSTALRLLFADREDVRDRLGLMTAPTLVVAGSQDSMYPLACQKSAAALLTRGRFEAVDSAHISAVDATAHVYSLLLAAWNAEKTPPGRRSEG